jgi:hypothetical protein
MGFSYIRIVIYNSTIKIIQGSEMEDNRIDASDVQTRATDWWLLYENGELNFLQGEPGCSEGYLLPDFDDPAGISVAGLGLCLIHRISPDEWFLAPARHGVGAWEIAAGYFRLGYIPPIALIPNLTTMPRIPIEECREILDVYRRTSHLHKGEKSALDQVLLHLKSNIT